MYLKSVGITNKNENDKQFTNNSSVTKMISKQDIRIPNTMLDLYSKSNLGLSRSNFYKTAKSNRYSLTTNGSKNIANPNSFSHNQSALSSKGLLSSTPSNNHTTIHNNDIDFEDYCRKMIKNDSEKDTETQKQESRNEEKKGLKSKNSGSSRYKTELCRPFEENGSCKYAEKCQFAHGRQDVRNLVRHPKYKTDLCKTYHTTGLCPYGLRCHFIHNNQERQISSTNRLIMELSEKTFMIKQQSSFFNHKLIASLLNGQQQTPEDFDNLPKSLSLQSSLKQNDQNNLFRQVLNSDQTQFLQQTNRQANSMNRPLNQAPMFCRSMDSSSPSASSSLNESPTISPTNLPTLLPIQLPTTFSNRCHNNLTTHYPPHMLYRDEKRVSEFCGEDVLSAKLKSIMLSAGL